jgi:hypothetical protein
MINVSIRAGLSGPASLTSVPRSRASLQLGRPLLPWAQPSLSVEARVDRVVKPVRDRPAERHCTAPLSVRAAAEAQATHGSTRAGAGPSRSPSSRARSRATTRSPPLRSGPTRRRSAPSRGASLWRARQHVRARGVRQKSGRTRTGTTRTCARDRRARGPARRGRRATRRS